MKTIEELMSLIELGDSVDLGVIESYVRELADEKDAEIEVLTNALWKACGDDKEIVNATIESQRT